MEKEEEEEEQKDLHHRQYFGFSNFFKSDLRILMNHFGSRY